MRCVMVLSAILGLPQSLRDCLYQSFKRANVRICPETLDGRKERGGESPAPLAYWQFGRKREVREGPGQYWSTHKIGLPSPRPGVLLTSSFNVNFELVQACPATEIDTQVESAIHNVAISLICVLLQRLPGTTSASRSAQLFDSLRSLVTG